METQGGGAHVRRRGRWETEEVKGVGVLQKGRMREGKGVRRGSSHCSHRVSDHGFALLICREVVQQLQRTCPVCGCAKESNQFGHQSALHHLSAEILFEVEESMRGVEEKIR